MMEALLLLTALATLKIAAHATSWTVYHDQDFIGYTITYPSFFHFVSWRVFHPDEEKTTYIGIRLVYASEDGAKLQFSFFYCDASTTVQSYFQDEMKYRQDKGDTVTYSVVKNNWYVVSGSMRPGNHQYYKELIILAPKPETTWVHPTHLISVIRKMNTQKYAPYGKRNREGTHSLNHPLYRRAVNETDQEIRGIQLGVFDKASLTTLVSL